MKFNIINHQIEGVGGCDADEGDDEVPSTFESLKRNLLTSDRQQPSSSQDGNSNHRHSNSPTHGNFGNLYFLYPISFICSLYIYYGRHRFCTERKNFFQ